MKQAAAIVGTNYLQTGLLSCSGSAAVDVTTTGYMAAAETSQIPESALSNASCGAVQLCVPRGRIVG